MKSSKYEKIISIIEDMQSSDQWKLVDETVIHDGVDLRDVDHVLDYYNEKKNKAVEFIINHYNKEAHMKKLKPKDLFFMGEQPKSK